MDTTTLQSAIAAFKQDNDLSALKTSLMAFFQIPSIAPELDAWLSGEEPPKGRFLITSFERACEWVPTFQHLLQRFGEVPFPALNIGGDWEGVEFWLVLETGRVITLHHDATFYEEASNIKTDDISEFMRRFERVGSTFSFLQLCQLSVLMAPLKKDDEDEAHFERELMKAAANALGMRLRDVSKLIETPSFAIVHQQLSYFYDFPDDYEVFLDEEDPLP